MELLSIGQLLRQERETKGLQLSDVQAATRITVQNLEALESDQFDAFPNRVYARAFLRDYSNFLGLDSASLLDQYEIQSGRVQQQSPPAKTSERSSAVVLGFAVLIILVMVGLAFYKPIMSVFRPAPQPQAVSPTPVTPETSAPAAPATAPPEESAKPAPVEGITLETKAISATWMRISVDGQQVYEGIMAPGQVTKWHGNKVIYFRTGNAGGVSLTLNGEPLPPLGKSGQVYQGKFVAASENESTGAQPQTETTSPNS